MWIESWAYNEQEKKKKEKTEKQKKQDKQKVLEQERKKKEAREKNDSDDILSKLEEMLEEWNLSENDINTIKKIVDKADISDEEIEDILEKIDEIEKTQDVDKYLPKEFRISPQDYKKSLTDNIVRVQTITKLDTALTILARQIAPDSAMGINLFSWYMVILDKKLIKIQENTIDISGSLKKVEEINNPSKQEKLSLWQRFVRFLKEIFSS